MNNALDRLPLSLDEVTPEWLTSVLQVRYPGVEITGVTRDREFFGTAASARMHLSYVDPFGRARRRGARFRSRQGRFRRQMA